MVEMKRPLILIIIYGFIIIAADSLQFKHENLNLNNFHFQSLKHGKSKRDSTFIEKYLLNTNELIFDAFGRQFHIFLKKNLNVLSNDVNIEIKYATSSSNLNDIFTSNFYTGFVDDEQSSSVLIYYDHDQIVANKTVIYGKIEIGSEIFYIEPLNIDDQKFIIYRNEDVKTDLINNGIFNQSFCKQKRIETKESEHRPDDSEPKKRSIGLKKRCKIALVADHRYFKEIGNSNAQLTTLNMINVMTSVDTIFGKTNFGDEISDVGFDIEKIIVHAEPDKRNDHYNRKANYESADDVLDLFGLDDWTSYCLAHLFTFQAFEGNVLGLAYVSSPRTYSYGGMCSGIMSRKGTLFSSNIGLSSYKSPSASQNRLLQTEAELVTAHELGHNWGSEHDPATYNCTPAANKGGNYIMFAYANQGYDENNFKFSPCSVISMSEVLKAKSSVCFKERSQSFCGNSRIEAGEECDGGIGTRQGTDPCCDSKCMFKEGAICSDLNHDCCLNCQYAPAKRVCFTSRTYTECYNQKAFCTGINKTCPEQQPSTKGTPCSKYEKGVCSGFGQCYSICQQRDVAAEPCFCTETDNQCLQCCRKRIASSTQEYSKCMPFHQLFKSPQVNLTDGRSCFQGRCESLVCKKKVKDNINRFWKVIEKLSTNAALEFMKRNIVGTIIVISLIFWIPISCCIHFCIDKRIRAEQKNEFDKLSKMHKQRNNNRRLFTDATDSNTQKEQLLSNLIDDEI